MYARFPVLSERKGVLAGTLSGGEQQLLALVRGLMARPRLLLLDEPSLGLSPMPLRQVFRAIADLRQAGLTVLLAEQNVYKALEVAKHAFVLQGGQVVFSGPAQDVATDERMRELYLGGRVPTAEA
jgi:branched-chain amino acid transport system ATP-binding protein